jgi:predicted DNA-binding transcriptional regulator AlpA
MKTTVQEPAQLPIRILRLGQAAEMVGLPTKSVVHKHRPGSVHYDSSFPVPIQLTQRTVGWYQHELVHWIMQRSRAGGAL